jgi:hypothetical protein
VRTDIVGTIQYSDGMQGAFEESGGHVCFTKHDGFAAWARVQVKN